jgi:phosphoribosylaminoimidazolecarboxamide formyltransferase / IMP cyclohydrolase
MGNELALKYGCNPNQKPARIYRTDGNLPLEVLGGKPGYINFLDALNGWQLVKELQAATGVPAAASFKHVSPAGAAIGLPLSASARRICYIRDDEPLTPQACAYARARGADRVSSYGDFIALSGACDIETARLIAKEVSDGIIAPDYDPEALEILKNKRKGNYNILKMDSSFVPDALERRMCCGITFEQGRNNQEITDALLSSIVTDNKDMPAEARRDLVLSMITLKYTQSNSVCYARDGQAIGIGAGQQSRIQCTRLAGAKADTWHLRQHPKTMALPFISEISRPERDNAVDLYLSDEGDDLLDNDLWRNYFTSRPEPLSTPEKKVYLSRITGVALGSDAFFPFGDNIERGYKSGVSYIAQPGGSIRDDDVIAACNRHDIAMAFTGVRLFHH